MSIDKSINNTLPTTSCKNSDWNVNSQTSFNLDNHTNVLYAVFSPPPQKKGKKRKRKLGSILKFVLWVCESWCLKASEQCLNKRETDGLTHLGETHIEQIKRIRLLWAKMLIQWVNEMHNQVTKSFIAMYASILRSPPSTFYSQQCIENRSNVSSWWMLWSAGRPVQNTDSSNTNPYCCNRGSMWFSGLAKI